MVKSIIAGLASGVLALLWFVAAREPEIAAVACPVLALVVGLMWRGGGLARIAVVSCWLAVAAAVVFIGFGDLRAEESLMLAALGGAALIPLALYVSSQVRAWWKERP